LRVKSHFANASLDLQVYCAMKNQIVNKQAAEKTRCESIFSFNLLCYSCLFDLESSEFKCQENKCKPNPCQNNTTCRAIPVSLSFIVNYRITE
jgi:hypothetical protein